MSLATLFAASGVTAEFVSRELGVSPFLFDRVDAGRQGLAAELVTRIAALLSVDPTEVVSAASRVVAAKSWPRSGAALPARTDLGEPLPHVLLHRIPPVELPPRVAPVPRSFVWFTYGSGGPTLRALGPGVEPGVGPGIGPGIGGGQFLAAIDRAARTLASARNVLDVEPFFPSIDALAFDGSQVWATTTNMRFGFSANTATTLASASDAPISVYSDWRYGIMQTGAAAAELGDTTSGLWVTAFGFGEIFTFGFNRLDRSDGSVLDQVQTFIPVDDVPQPAPPWTCTVLSGKVAGVATTLANGASVARFIRVDAPTATQDAVSSGYDFTASWMMWAPQPNRLQVAATRGRAGDALWIVEPAAPWMNGGSNLLRCDLATMIVTQVPIVDGFLGTWAGGAACAGDAVLWFGCLVYSDDLGFDVPVIFKLSTAGAVLASITRTDVPNMSDVSALVADPDGGCVWAAVTISNPMTESVELRVLRIDAASATVTDSIFVVSDWMMRVAFDMVLGA